MSRPKNEDMTSVLNYVHAYTIWRRVFNSRRCQTNKQKPLCIDSNAMSDANHGVLLMGKFIQTYLALVIHLRIQFLLLGGMKNWLNYPSEKCLLDCTWCTRTSLEWRLIAIYKYWILLCTVCSTNVFVHMTKDHYDQKVNNVKRLHHRYNHTKTQFLEIQRVPQS